VPPAFCTHFPPTRIVSTAGGRQNGVCLQQSRRHSPCAACLKHSLSYSTYRQHRRRAAERSLPEAKSQAQSLCRLPQAFTFLPHASSAPQAGGRTESACNKVAGTVPVPPASSIHFPTARIVSTAGGRQNGVCLKQSRRHSPCAACLKHSLSYRTLRQHRRRAAERSLPATMAQAQSLFRPPFALTLLLAGQFR
jgi:hypothetical protein